MRTPVLIGLLFAVSLPTSALAHVDCHTDTGTGLYSWDEKHLSQVGSSVQVRCDGKLDSELSTCADLNQAVDKAFKDALSTEFFLCLILGGSPSVVRPVRVDPAEGYCTDEKWGSSAQSRGTVLKCGEEFEDFACDQQAQWTVGRSVLGYDRDVAEALLLEWSMVAVESEQQYYRDLCEANGGTLEVEVTWGDVTASVVKSTLYWPPPTKYSIKHDLDLRCVCPLPPALGLTPVKGNTEGPALLTKEPSSGIMLAE